MYNSYSTIVAGSSYRNSSLNSIFYKNTSSSSSSTSTSSTTSTTSSSNVSSSDGLTGFEKELYEEIETLFENNAHSDMLTNSVHITDDAMALMESDEDFKKEMMSSLVEQLRTSAGTSDGYHGVINITTSGVKMSTTTVSTYESDESKTNKENKATDNAKGSFFTYKITDKQSTTTSSSNSLLSATTKNNDENDYYSQYTALKEKYGSTPQGLSYYSQSLLDRLK